MTTRDEYGFKVGDHLVTDRILYTHHGIYAGGGKVIHYAGLADGWGSAPVEKTSLAKFANGNGIGVKPHPGRRHGRMKSVKRARRRLGEDDYSVVFNNCEHFVNWCIEGKAESEQVRDAVWKTAVVMVPRLLLPF